MLIRICATILPSGSTHRGAVRNPALQILALATYPPIAHVKMAPLKYFTLCIIFERFTPNCPTHKGFSLYLATIDSDQDAPENNLACHGTTDLGDFFGWSNRPRLFCFGWSFPSHPFFLWFQRFNSASWARIKLASTFLDFLGSYLLANLFTLGRILFCLDSFGQIFGLPSTVDLFIPGSTSTQPFIYLAIFTADPHLEFYQEFCMPIFKSILVNLQSPCISSPSTRIKMVMKRKLFLRLFSVLLNYFTV